jgi:hypothetical protein
MSANLVAFIVVACTFGGAVAGLLLQRVLPGHHLGDASKDTVKLTMGLVGSLTALVLGLVTASAKSSYDAVDGAIKETAVEVLTLDRVLARYGPEAVDLRHRLAEVMRQRVGEIWPESVTAGVPATAVVPRPVSFNEEIADRLSALEPASEGQRALHGRAVELVERLLEQRWLTVSHRSAPVPTAFVVILVFWLTATFGSFGLFAPRNATVLTVLFLGSVSVAAALFLVFELGSPFQGVAKVSAEPMLRTLALLGK